MTHQAEMTFRVESDLSVAFTEQVESEHRELDEVMQEMMQAYLARARNASPEHTDEQRQTQQSLRQQAVDFARASVGLEGFTPSESAEMFAAQYVNGEIDIVDFVHATKASIKSNAAE